MEDLHKKWPHRWITSKAKCFDSKIDRWGVVTIKDIKKGEAVGVLGGIIIPSIKMEEYWKLIGHVGIQISDDFFIVPSEREELKETGVFNHSCNPNCGFEGSTKLIAIKDIEEGEELTFDYAFCETLIREFKCNCGSLKCRKIIKPTDWKIKELQEKYFEYFSPYLKEKINKTN